jgi:endonuclease/exonuclease/phosphatase family metal-dependent hydrolase
MEIKILNINLWAVELSALELFFKSPSVELEQRIGRLAHEIDKISPDIVVFQEVWSEKRKNLMIQMMKEKGYFYSVAKSSAQGWLLKGGNGLLVVSKFPLCRDVKAMAYSHSTRWSESSAICKKGALKTRIQIEDQSWVDLYATHLGSISTENRAGRAHSFTEAHVKNQIKQTSQLVDFIKQTHTSDSLVLAADLNSHCHEFFNGYYNPEKYSEVYSLLTSAGKPADDNSCLNLIDGAIKTSINDETCRFTYDTINNPYAKSADYGKEPPGRIDYLFSSGSRLEPKSHEVVFKDNPVSDHYGIVTTFSCQAKSSSEAA